MGGEGDQETRAFKDEGLVCRDDGDVEVRGRGGWLESGVKGIKRPAPSGLDNSLSADFDRSQKKGLDLW